MIGQQRTIANSVTCVGIGLHSGKKTHMRLEPANEDVGIVFKRTDIDDRNPFIPAVYNNVSSTTLCTTLSNEDGVEIATIEHLMAALWGCGVDNCVVEIDGPEVPIMDGSSEPFVFLIECAGILKQQKSRKIIEVLKEVTIKDKDGYVTITPSNHFGVSLEIDFNNKVIANQSSRFVAGDFCFKNDLCRARTFGMAHEVEYLRQNGLAKGGSLDNAVVVGEDGVLNEDGLRYDDEFVRHKILDCIGDVYLAGGHIKGHLKGFKSGHALNNQLLRKFFADQDAWRMVQIPEQSASIGPAMLQAAAMQ